MVNKKLILMFVCVFLALAMVSAESEVLVDYNFTEHNIYGVNNLNSTNGFFTNLFSSFYNWTILSSSNLWLTFTGSELSFNEIHLNNTIKSIDTETNTSMKNYVDGTFLTQSNEGNLNVNNSIYFDDYTPTTLKDWIQTSFDSIYCKLTGCEIDGNITADNFLGNLSWNNLKDYPLACPAGTAITQLGDSVVCSSFVPYTGATDNLDLGIYNITTTGRINLNNGAYNSQVYTDENGTINMVGQNGVFKIY